MYLETNDRLNSSEHKMSDILLSVCISSYNKGDRCRKLIQDILSVKDDRYNIFICDDCSDNETVDQLQALQGSKVTLILSKKNRGACKNWYKTINSGNGKYILHVLDRDDIDVNYIGDVLRILEEHTVGGGYIGKSAMNINNEKNEQFVILKREREAFLTMAGVPIHPTGFLVNRQQWIEGNFKRFFYCDEKYGIYPHSYVLGRIAAHTDMLSMSGNFYSYIYKGTNGRSKFYKKSETNYWWLPDSVMKTTSRLIQDLYKFVDGADREEFICRRLCDGLYRATMGYKCTVSNVSEMRHYGIGTIYVSQMQLIWISIRFQFVCWHMLRRLHISGKRIRGRLIKIWFMNIRSIMIRSE